MWKTVIVLVIAGLTLSYICFAKIEKGLRSQIVNQSERMDKELANEIYLISNAVPKLRNRATHALSKQYIQDLVENINLIKQEALISNHLTLHRQKYGYDGESSLESMRNSLCDIVSRNYQILKSLSAIYRRRSRYLQDTGVLSDFQNIFNEFSALNRLNADAASMNATVIESMLVNENASKKLKCATSDKKGEGKKF